MNAKAGTMAAPRTTVALALESPQEESLWHAALASQGLSAFAVQRSAAGFAPAIKADGRLAGAAALLVDAPPLLSERRSLQALAAWCRVRHPGMAVFARLPARASVSLGEQVYARQAGLEGIIPGSTAADWHASMLPGLTAILRAVGRGNPEPLRLDQALTRMVHRGEEPRQGPVKDTYTAAHHLQAQGIDPQQALRRMQGSVPVADRRYRGAMYRECFVAVQALEWLETSLGLQRHTAMVLGRYLWGMGRIHHVVRAHRFEDQELYFRFAGEEARIDAVDLAELARSMRAPGGVPIADRVHAGKSYRRAFVGSQAVDWMASRHGLRIGEAEALGQRLLDLGLIRHVAAQRGFSDAHFFYRFAADDEPGA